MAIKEMELSAGGGAVSLELVFGHLNSAGYRLAKTDENEENPIDLGSGLSRDPRPDTFLLPGAASDWNRKFLKVFARILSPDPDPQGPATQYSMKVIVTQGGTDVEGSPATYQGSLDEGTKVLLESIRFTTV